MRFKYEDRSTPPDYTCSVCGVRNVKLWRGYNDFDITLLCMTCAVEKRGKGPLRWDEGDSCGWTVPAVPTEDGAGYWGYSSVPLRGCRWWHQLVPLAPADRHPEYFLGDDDWLTYLDRGARDGDWYLRRYFRPEALTVAMRMIASKTAEGGRSLILRFRTRAGNYRVAGRRFRTAALARQWILASA